MSLLSPSATYHAELRQQLESVGRALSVQRALLWLSRGLAAGTVVVLGVVIWGWIGDTLKNVPLAVLIGLPLVVAMLTAVGSMVIRQSTPELARRVDRAASLHERSTTALELGTRGDDFPLAIAQMRDAVEHLRRIDLLEAFPMRFPRNELLTTFFVGLVATIVAVSPNPWLLRARASNPAITIAREEAQRVQRLADNMQSNNPQIDALRQMISKGAKTMDARSDSPDAALNALQDLEQQVQDMSAGDDQLSAALAAIASALASNQSTQALSDAINTGDMHQISQAARDLAQAAAQMSPQDQQQLAQTLRDAAASASRVSPNVANDLSNAADGLQSAALANAADASATDQQQQGQNGQSAAGQQGQQGQPGQQGASSGAQSAQDALNQLANNTAAADARQTAASQLESSRNALERALGRTQSRSGSSSSSTNRSSNGQSSNGQAQGQGSQSQQGDGQGQNGDQSATGGDQNGGTQGGDQGNGGNTGQGGGSSTGGGQDQNTGAGTGLDPILDPQQVASSGAAPDQSSMNPYTTDAGTGNAHTAPEAVQPSYSNGPTQGNDSGSIPLGLRDLVKDYFSSLDQK